tara:strand:- start:339 stop:869 length:531 start_codon:yes stop_codon:yes gene_type:complete
LWLGHLVLLIFLWLAAAVLVARPKVLVAAVLVVLSIFRNEHLQPVLILPLLELAVLVQPRTALPVWKVETLRLTHRPRQVAEEAVKAMGRINRDMPAARAAAEAADSQPVRDQARQTKEIMVESHHHRITQMKIKVGVEVALVQLGLPPHHRPLVMAVLDIQRVQQFMIGNLVAVL